MEKTFINYMFSGFYQIGFVTKNMEKATSFFQNTMGVPKFLKSNSPDVKNQSLYGKPINIDVNLAFGQMGNTNIEIIQPLSGNSTYNVMLERYDLIGIHHIAIKVFDFDKTISDLTEKGFAIAQTGEVGKGTKFHYIDMLKEMGYYLEVLFFDEDFEKMFDQIRRGDF